MRRRFHPFSTFRFRAARDLCCWIPTFRISAQKSVEQTHTHHPHCKCQDVQAAVQQSATAYEERPRASAPAMAETCLCLCTTSAAGNKRKSSMWIFCLSSMRKASPFLARRSDRQPCGRGTKPVASVTFSPINQPSPATSLHKARLVIFCATCNEAVLFSYFHSQTTAAWSRAHTYPLAASSLGGRKRALD